MQAGGEPGPSNPSAAENRNSDAVLNEVLVNQSALKQATIHGHATEVGTTVHRGDLNLCIGGICELRGEYTSLPIPKLLTLVRFTSSIQDQDLVLAKMLQEQERAFLALAGGAVLAHG